MVLLSGIILLGSGIALATAQVIIDKANSPPYSINNVVIYPQEKEIGNVNLNGENEVEIRLSVKQEGTPVQVTLLNKDKEKVGELISGKRFDFVVFDNPFGKGEFTVISENLGENFVNVYVSVRDVKPPGTYIESYDAWQYLSWPTTILVGLGIIVLITGGIIFLGTKRKTIKDKSH